MTRPDDPTLGPALDDPDTNTELDDRSLLDASCPWESYEMSDVDDQGLMNRLDDRFDDKFFRSATWMIGGIDPDRMIDRHRRRPRPKEDETECRSI